MIRKLVIHCNKNYLVELNKIIMSNNIANQIKDRNISISVKDGKNKMELYGYDQELKYTTETISKGEFHKIFSIIDTMPIRQMEMMSFHAADNNII